MEAELPFPISPEAQSWAGISRVEQLPTSCFGLLEVSELYLGQLEPIAFFEAVTFLALVLGLFTKVVSPVNSFGPLLYLLLVSRLFRKATFSVLCPTIQTLRWGP